MEGDLFKNLEFKVIGNLELQKEEEGSGRRIIRGYAAVAGNLDRQNEIITHEALVSAKNDLLSNPTVFFNHEHARLPIGKVIKTEIDNKGLLVTIEFTKAPFAEDIWSLIEEKILDRFSIGGRVLDSTEKRDKSGNLFTEINRLELFEVSVVGIPANPEARFQLVSKSFTSAISEAKDKKLTEEVNNKEGDKEMAKEEQKSEQELQKDVEESVEESVENIELNEEIKKTDLVEDTVDKPVYTSSTLNDPTTVSIDDTTTSDSTILDINNFVEKQDGTVDGQTSEDDWHWHWYDVDTSNNGKTIAIATKPGYTGDANHKHEIIDGVVQEADGHTHTLEEMKRIEEEKAIEDTSEVKKEKEDEKQEEVNLNKGVIVYHDLGIAPKEESWDGPAEVQKASVEDLKQMCAWFDSENPDVEASYKLPHHRQSDKKAVWHGVAAAMAALLGARGGVDIPESDKKGVYDHLSAHYTQFEEVAPEFKSYTDEELNTLFLNNEKQEEVKEEPQGKTLDDLIIEALNKLIQLVSDKTVVQENEIVVQENETVETKEKIIEVETEEMVVEKVVDTELDKNQLEKPEVKENKIEEKVDQEVEKVEQKVEVVRKSEAIIAETPYADPLEENLNTISLEDLKKLKEKGWTKLIWGK